MDTAAENNIVSDLYHDGRAVAISSLQTFNNYHCVFNDTSYIALDRLINHVIKHPLIYDTVFHEDSGIESVKVTGEH